MAVTEDAPDIFVPGDTPWFEYHCNESHDSPDAPAWLRSHQRVVVLRLNDPDNALGELPTFAERDEEGRFLVYRVRFPDGLEWDVFEDELVIDRALFCRPDPPSRTQPRGVFFMTHLDVIARNGVPFRAVINDNDDDLSGVIALARRDVISHAARRTGDDVRRMYREEMA